VLDKGMMENSGSRSQLCVLNPNSVHLLWATQCTCTSLFNPHREAKTEIQRGKLFTLAQLVGEGA
jgi:hypothetical protein